MKTIIATFIILGFSISLVAQTPADALRFSRVTNSGTARSAAMGGAFGALGGDISSMNSNPAGVGVFRKNELSVTPLLNFNKTKSGDRNATDNTFQLGNLGGVFSFGNESHNWKNFNFGISYTNMANFNSKTDQAVIESQSSLTDVWVALSNGTISDHLSVYDTRLAYDTYLINATDPTTYQSVLLDGELVNQYKMVKEDGYQGEYAFSFGTNYKDKLYLGMTVGLQSLYYKTRSTYTELAALDSELDFFNFTEYTKISGVGTNLKFGLIYRPIPQLRFGAAIHTPTWYSMSQSIENGLYSQFNTPDNPDTEREYQDYQASSGVDNGNDYGPYRFDYDLKTPWRAILSVATVIGQKAILSADYEYVDYASARLDNSSDDHSFHDENSTIKDIYQSGHNVRVGAEYRVNTTLSLRGGYSFQGSPYKYASDYSKRQSVSGGIGLNFGSFYCDAAYTYRFSKDDTRFYDYDGFIADAISNKYINNEARLTLGLKF